MRATPTARGLTAALPRTDERAGRFPAVDLAWSGLTFLGSLLVLAWKLGSGSLFDWDEATYAEISREIYVFHDWIHLHWNYQPWFNKPPLYIWLTALVFHFGTNEFLARLVSAISGAVLVGIVYLFASRWYGRTCALLAVVVLLTCYGFVGAARFGTSDELLAACMYGAVFAYALAGLGNRRWWYVSGACFGLALMTKGIAALVVLGAIGIAFLLDRRASELTSSAPWLGLGIALVIALPWHLAALLWQGGAFIHQYVGYMVLSRASTPLEGHSGNASYYFVLVRNQLYPWVYLVPFALALHVLVALRSRSTYVVAVFPTVVLVLYTAVRSKLSWYAVPVYPAFAVMVGQLLSTAAGRFTGLPSAPRWLQPASLVVVGVGMVIAAVWIPRSVNRGPVFLLVAALAVAVGLLVVGAASLWNRRLPETAHIAAVGVAVAVLAALAVVVLYPLYNQKQSPVVAVAHDAGQDADDGPVFLYIGDRDRYTDDDVSHSLLFYSHRRVVITSNAADVARLGQSGRRRDVVLKAKYLARVRRQLPIQPLTLRPPFIYARFQARS